MAETAAAGAMTAEGSTSMAASASATTAPTSERQPRQQPEDEVVRRTIKRRPARKQVGVDEIEKKQPAQNGQTFNVWYNKCAWPGPRSAPPCSCWRGLTCIAHRGRRRPVRQLQRKGEEPDAVQHREGHGLHPRRHEREPLLLPVLCKGLLSKGVGAGGTFTIVNLRLS